MYCNLILRTLDRLLDTFVWIKFYCCNGYETVGENNWFPRHLRNKSWDFLRRLFEKNVVIRSSEQESTKLIFSLLLLYFIIGTLKEYLTLPEKMSVIQSKLRRINSNLKRMSKNPQKKKKFRFELTYAPNPALINFTYLTISADNSGIRNAE